MSDILYECPCPKCREVLTDESATNLASRMWVHEAKHPDGVPSLDEIYRRIKRAEPIKEGVLLR